MHLLRSSLHMRDVQFQELQQMLVMLTESSAVHFNIDFVSLVPMSHTRSSSSKLVESLALELQEQLVKRGNQQLQERE